MRFTVLTISVLVAVFAGSRVASLPPDPVSMGTVDLNGGTSSPANDFSTAAHPFGITPDIVGGVKNSLGNGRNITGMTIEIVPIGPGNAPKLKTAKVGSTTGTSANGRSIRLQLDAGSRPDPIGGNETANVEIDLEPGDNPAAADFSLKFTSAEKVKKLLVQSDALGWMEVGSDATTGSKSLTLHGNPATSLDLKNDDANSSLTGISGTYSLGTGRSLINVRLFDPRNDDGELTGLTKVVTGRSFSLSGFTVRPGRTVAIVFEFDGTPTDTSALELSTRYRNPR